VVTSEGVRWLIMGPIGTPLPWHPETTVLGHVLELAAVIGELKKAGWLHCDISYFNCMIFPGKGAGLIDLGAAKTLAQVRSSYVHKHEQFSCQQSSLRKVMSFVFCIARLKVLSL